MNSRSCDNLSMTGKVRRNRGNFYIDLWWEGTRYSIYSDRDGVSFGKSQKHADRLLSHIRYEIDHGIFEPKAYIKRELKGLLFANYAEVWLERQRLKMEQGFLARETFRTRQRHIKNHLAPLLASRNIRDFNAGVLEDLMLRLPKDLSAKSVKDILGTLRKIFGDAQDREDISRIPKFPKVDVGEPETKWLGPEEQEEILDQITDLCRKAFFIFLMDMGCRPSEGRALRWECVSFKTDRVKIIAGMDGEVYRPSTKEKDKRELPMSPRVIEALKALPRDLCGFVFTFRGRPFTHKLIDRTWRRACKAVGIEGICLYQGTKHSLGTWAATSGIPMNLIQDYFGHKCQSSTRRYAKLAKVETLRVMHQPRANCMQFEKKKNK